MHENTYCFYKMLMWIHITSKSWKFLVSIVNQKLNLNIVPFFDNSLWSSGPVGTLNNNTQQVWLRNGFSTPVWKPESVFLAHCYSCKPASSFHLLFYSFYLVFPSGFQDPWNPKAINYHSCAPLFQLFIAVWRFNPQSQKIWESFGGAVLA